MSSAASVTAGAVAAGIVVSACTNTEPPSLEPEDLVPVLGVEQEAAALKVRSSGHGAVAYLLPPDMEESSVNAAADRFSEDGNVTVNRDGAQLIVVSPATARAVGEVEIDREDGEPVVLSPM